MAQQQSPWLEGAYGWNFGEGGWNSGMDQNLLKFSFMFDRNVDSIVASLPAAVNGQAHYLTTDNRLYFAVGTTYFSTVVPKWFEVKVRSTGDTYQFNGTSANIINSPAQLDTRLDTVELTVAALGTAAFEDIEFFATQADLDIVEADAQSYTDALRSDLSSDTGASLVGYSAGTTVAEKIASVEASIPTDITSLGVIGDGVVDDSDALEAAIVSGVPLDFLGLNIRVTRALTGVITGTLNWVANNATVFYDGGIAASAVLDFEVQPAFEHRIVGKISVDGSSLAFRGIHLWNKSILGFPTGFADFYASDLEVRNIRRADSSFTGGDGITIRGGFQKVQFDRPVVKNVRLAAGAGIPGSVGITGITVFGNIDGYPIQTIVNDALIDGVFSEDAAYSSDQDGLRVFGPWVTAPGQANSVLAVKGGQFRNCWGRSIKAQTTTGTVDGTNFARFSGPTGGGNSEIDFQVGSGFVRDIQCHYSGANSVPNEVVIFQANENLESFAGVASGIKVFTTNSFPQVVSTFPRARTQHQTIVRDVDVIGPIERLLAFRVWSDKSVATISNCTVNNLSAELVSVTQSGLAGSPYVGTVNVRDCINLGTVRALVTDRIGGVSADAIVSDVGCVGFTQQTIFASTITPKGGALRVSGLLGEDVSSGSMKIYSKSIANGATDTFPLHGYNATAAAIVSFGFTNQSHALVTVSSSGVISLASGTGIVVGTTADPGTGTFRLWVSGGLLQVKNTAGSARQCTLFYMG
jgi:hypothetical protein